MQLQGCPSFPEALTSPESAPPSVPFGHTEAPSHGQHCHPFSPLGDSWDSEQRPPMWVGAQGGLRVGHIRAKRPPASLETSTTSQKERAIILPKVPKLPTLSAVGRTVSWGWPRQGQSSQMPLPSWPRGSPALWLAAELCAQALRSPGSPPKNLTSFSSCGGSTQRQGWQRGCWRWAARPHCS